jgi:hypothetical protein
MSDDKMNVFNDREFITEMAVEIIANVTAAVEKHIGALPTENQLVDALKDKDPMESEEVKRIQHTLVLLGMSTVVAARLAMTAGMCMKTVREGKFAEAVAESKELIEQAEDVVTRLVIGMLPEFEDLIAGRQSTRVENGSRVDVVDKIELEVSEDDF